MTAPKSFFNQKVVLITGGSRGLGLVMARQLARQGAKLVLGARDPNELQVAETECRGLGAETLTVRCDITERDQIEALVSQTIARFGRVDVLINNAGMIQIGPMEAMKLEDYEAAMRVHFWAPLYATLAVLPTMKAQGSGNIVNIASIGGKVAVPHLLPYDASKFALVGLSQGLREELSKDGIRVTTISPGLMRTGSLVQTIVKGNIPAEFTWMALTQASSATSLNVERAASQILRAIARGAPSAVIGIQAKVLERANALFPNTTTRVLSLISRALPRSDGQPPDVAQKGRAARPAWLPRIATILSDRASLANNEQ